MEIAMGTATATGTAMETAEEEEQETTCPLWSNMIMKTTKQMKSRWNSMNSDTPFRQKFP